MFHIIPFITLFIYLQTAGWQIIETIPVNAKKTGIDHLQNIYMIAENQFTKFDKNGKSDCTYANNTSGNISSFDITDPMRILLFYEEYNQLQFLDNTLSPLKSPVLLDDLGIGAASLVCNSATGGFWIYNIQNQQLLKFNSNLQLEQKSMNIQSIVPEKLEPNFLIEKNNRVFLNNPETGILVFDIFGYYLKTVPIKKLQSFQVNGDAIYYPKANQLIVFNQKTLQFDSLHITNQENILDIKIEKDVAVLHFEDKIQIVKNK